VADGLIFAADRLPSSLARFSNSGRSLAAFLGPSLSNAMIAIGVSATPIFVRLTRRR